MPNTLKISSFLTILSISLAGSIISPLSSRADGWMVYGPNGSQQYCQQYKQGGDVFCM